MCCSTATCPGAPEEVKHMVTPSVNGCRDLSRQGVSPGHTQSQRRCCHVVMFDLSHRQLSCPQGSPRASACPRHAPGDSQSHGPKPASAAESCKSCVLWASPSSVSQEGAELAWPCPNPRMGESSGGERAGGDQSSQPGQSTGLSQVSDPGGMLPPCSWSSLPCSTTASLNTQ